MKCLRLLLLSLSIGFLSVNSMEAQLLKKLKQRVQEATEDVIAEKAAQKASQEVGKAMDSLLDIDENYQSNNQQQLQEMFNQSNENLPVEKIYQFHTNVIYQMETISKDNSSVVDYGMWFSENENYMATQVQNIASEAKDSRDLPSSMFSVLDEKNKTMIIFMEEQKIAQVLSMDKIKDIADLENQSEEANADFSGLKKTGKHKNILGYNCEEFESVNDENTFSFWVTDELKLFQKNMFFNLSKSLGGNSFENIPKDAKGFMMEMHFENKKSGDKGKMIVIDIKKQSKSISTDDYQFMNLSSFLKKD